MEKPTKMSIIRVFVIVIVILGAVFLLDSLFNEEKVQPISDPVLTPSTGAVYQDSINYTSSVLTLRETGYAIISLLEKDYSEHVFERFSRTIQDVKHRNHYYFTTTKFDIANREYMSYILLYDSQAESLTVLHFEELKLIESDLQIIRGEMTIDSLSNNLRVHGISDGKLIYNRYTEKVFSTRGCFEDNIPSSGNELFAMNLETLEITPYIMTEEQAEREQVQCERYIEETKRALIN